MKSFARLLVVTLVFLVACARAPLRGPENAMRRVSESRIPELMDDLPLLTLAEAIEDQIRFLESRSGGANIVMGEKVFSQESYIKGLKRFAQLIRTIPNSTDLFMAIRKEFDFYEVYGQRTWGDTFMTSYYEPLIKGSLKPSEKWSQALYAAPSDILSLDLTELDQKFSQERKYRVRLDGTRVVPYFSRDEIDSKNSLKGRKLEICWVDPIDAFFLQIQGSGTVELENGKRLQLNYAEKNGHPYEQLSKFLKGQIPAAQMNLHTIEAYLRKLSKPALQKVLNQNPSYVFFKTTEASALTYLGIPAVDGRTIATDKRYFPKGALGFISFEKPHFSNPGEIVPSSTVPSGRFILDQDIGGAIQGGGRLDLFWGRGAEAKLYAGAMKNRGKLYYLAPHAD